MSLTYHLIYLTPWATSILNVFSSRSFFDISTSVNFCHNPVRCWASWELKYSKVKSHTMANSRKFCALFLESSRSSLKTCQPCHYHLPTGLEATGGPLGPAQPLKASKLADKLHQKSIYTQCRWLTMLGPASKRVSHATITCQLG